MGLRFCLETTALNFMPSSLC